MSVKLSGAVALLPELLLDVACLAGSARAATYGCAWNADGLANLVIGGASGNAVGSGYHAGG